jgi:hypothetical protein
MKIHLNIILISRTIILPVVFYEFENWCLTLRVERRLRVFENRVRRKILGSERDGVTGEWRRLHDEELYNLYCSPKFWVINLRRMSWAGMWHLGWAGEIQTARVLVGKPEGKRPLGGSGCRWEENIQMYVQELERGSMGLDLA